VTTHPSATVFVANLPRERVTEHAVGRRHKADTSKQHCMGRHEPVLRCGARKRSETHLRADYVTA
jgi:hypothetical protein